MSTALDRFEESLVRASRELHEQQAARASVVGERAPSFVFDRQGLGARGKLRRRGWRIAAGVLLVGVLAAAATSVFGPSGNPREITQIECGQRGSSQFVTGEPLRDCATLWPSLYHHTAPALAAWVADTGGVVLVTPANQAPPGEDWRRLPKGWRADAALLLLNAQLEDITTGIEAHACWSAPAARALVRSTLRADRLSSWQVRVTAREGAPRSDCLHVDAATYPPSVLLVEDRIHKPASWQSPFPSGVAEGERLTSTERHVNSTLTVGGRCASVSQAAALWRSSARAHRISPTRYVLFTQEDGQGIGRDCAPRIRRQPGGRRTSGHLRSRCSLIARSVPVPGASGLARQRTVDLGAASSQEGEQPEPVIALVEVQVGHQHRWLLAGGLYELSAVGVTDER